MAKHVYPPLNFGVADSPSIDLNLDVARIITAYTIFGGSGGDFGVADTSARSDHTHITSYDGRYVLKAGDTMTGALQVNAAFGATGAVTLGSTLSVAAMATLAVGLTISSGGATITGNVGITGSLSASTTITAGTGLTVSAGGAAITGNATVSGTLGITGATSLSTLSTSGLATLNSATVTNLLTASGGITSAGINSFNRSGGNLTLNTPSTGQQAELWFSSNSTQKFGIYKKTNDDLAIYNNSITRDEVTFPAAGGVRFASMAGGGSTGVYVDNNGQFTPINFATLGNTVVLLATNNPSGVAISSFNNLFSATYDVYLFIYKLVRSANTATWIRIRSGTTDLVTASYQWSMESMISNAATVTGVNNNSDTIMALSTATGLTGDTTVGIVYIINPNLADYTFYESWCQARASTPVHVRQIGGGHVNNTTSYDGVSFACSAGTITGVIRAYGIRIA